MDALSINVYVRMMWCLGSVEGLNERSERKKSILGDRTRDPETLDVPPTRPKRNRRGVKYFSVTRVFRVLAGLFHAAV